MDGPYFLSEDRGLRGGHMFPQTEPSGRFPPELWLAEASSCSLTGGEGGRAAVPVP